jgi:SAM-dependent methyltransferase
LSRQCPLCAGTDTGHFCRVEDIDYHRCARCLLTWMAPEHRPSVAVEKEQYDLHENNEGDPGYRTFLSRLADPLLAELRGPASGLDFGCGPGPALAAICREAGHSMALYDPIYFPDRSVLDSRYDFVTCTEVAEHLHQPAREFTLFQQLLKPGGILGIMTCWLTDDDAFPRWHYRRDPTHVCFYRPETFGWLAEAFGWEWRTPRKDVVLFIKGEDSA